MLRLDNFDEISNQLVKSWFRGDMEQIFVDFVKDQYVADLFLPWIRTGQRG